MKTTTQMSIAYYAAWSAHSHLEAALAQATATDDQIIVEHIRAAAAQLATAMRALVEAAEAQL